MALKISMAKYRPQLVFALVSFAVLLPLCRPGFVLTLDMVFTPHIRMPENVTSSYLFYVVLHCLNVVVPAEVLQKLVLFAILYLSGWGMYRLARHVQSGEGDGDRAAVWGAYIAGLLYAINPFAYSRFMAGQFAVLLGYSLLPFVVYSLLSLLRRPSWVESIIFAAWVTGVGIVSIHSLGLVAVLLAVALPLAVWRYWHHRDRLVRTMKFLAVSVVLIFVLSSYWFVPLALGHGATANAIAGFTSGDQQAFETLGGSPVGRLANVARLQGFWAEGHGLFVLPQARMIGWGIVVLALWALVVVGARSAWRRGERFIVILLGASAGAGVLLAVNVVNAGLDRILPLFGGFREPQKFVALVALAYALFAGLGARVLLDRYGHADQRLKRAVALTGLLLLLVALTPTMYWGFGGQLQSRQYPASWAAMNKRLDQDRSTYAVLFLPWHLYMYYGFAGRIIASPATAYFDKPMIVSNQMELQGASPTTTDARKTLLSTTLLPKASEGIRLGARLAPLHIKYILLDKDDDYLKYAYLDRQADLQVLVDNTNFRLYQNMAYRSAQ